MKVEKLNIDKDQNTEPKIVFGIAAALDFYRMAYFLAKTFEKEPEKVTKDIFEQHNDFTLYKFEIDENELILIKNQLPEGFFFVKAKQADYLIIASGPSAQLLINSLKEKLKKVVSVQSLFAIEEKFFTKSKLKYFDQTSI